MWYHPRPGMESHGAALIGVYVAVIGFGVLALDAAIGILLIPAGLLLAIFGHGHQSVGQRTASVDSDDLAGGIIDEDAARLRRSTGRLASVSIAEDA